MCAVSNIGDYGRSKYWPSYPQPWEPTPQIPVNPFYPSPDQERIRNIEQEIEELKKLLKEAKRFDEATGQPDCELENKFDWLKDLEEMIRKAKKA